LKEKIFALIAVLSLLGILAIKQIEQSRSGNEVRDGNDTNKKENNTKDRARHRTPPVIFYAPGQRPVAPSFELPLLQGGTLNSSSFKDKVVMINFWATWCPPCIDELPSLEILDEQIKDKDFLLVTINVDKDKTAAARLLSRLVDMPGGKVPGYIIALDPSGKLAASYGTTKFPETYLVGPNGRILVKFIGPRNWDRPIYIKLIRSVLASGTTPSMAPMGGTRP